DASRVDPAKDAGEPWGENVGNRASCACHAAYSVARAASRWPCTPTSSEAVAPAAGPPRPASADGARSTFCTRASRRLGLRPVLVQPLLEQLPQMLACRRTLAVPRQDPHETHPFVAVAAVDAGVALCLGQLPEPHVPTT